MKLSFENAVAEHRAMWSWIANESEKRNELMSKSQYLVEHGWAFLNIRAQCFCCEYTTQFYNDGQQIHCEFCPIHWTEDPNVVNYCSTGDSLWAQWYHFQKEYRSLCEHTMPIFSKWTEKERMKQKERCLIRCIQIAREFASKPAREMSDIDIK